MAKDLDFYIKYVRLIGRFCFEGVEKNMLCQICRVEQAVVTILEFTSLTKRKQELHLCLSCALKHSFEKINAFPVSNSVGVKFFSNNIQNFLKNVLPIDNKMLKSISFSQNDKDDKTKTERKDIKKCDICGAAWDDIVQNMQVRCPQCYEVFKTELKRYLPVFQRSFCYVGGSPDSNKEESTLECENIRREISTLNVKIKESLVREEFLEAAEMRDKIKMLETQLTALKNAPSLSNNL